MNTGPVIINDRTIIGGADNHYSYDYRENNTLSEGKLLMGSTNVKVTATAARTNIRQTATMHVPKALFPDRSFYPTSTIDKAIALPIKWAPDPNNPSQIVKIEISYHKGISQNNLPDMPDAISPVFYEVPDNGLFAIPQTDLNRFPNGSYIGISISRSWNSNNSTDDIAYLSFTDVSTVPELVTDSRSLTIDFKKMGVNLISTIIGGIPPFKYAWSNSTINSASVIFNGVPCSANAKVSSMNVTLTVTDNSGRVKTITKPVTYICMQ